MPQEPWADLRHPYLTRQLIAYIGNKRRLLPLLHSAVSSACGADGKGLTFVDLFAGSGAVSRMAKLMGFRVFSNDWEEFARVINTAHVATAASEADRLLAGQGGLSEAIRRLNALDGPPGDGEYIARYYAPRSDDAGAADYRRERLFYSRANALAIDRARAEIDRLYPPGTGTPALEKTRALLVASLLYEASTHANTSGVFKAFHKGFGGHGRDALGRILAPLELEVPVLVDSAEPATVLAEDANLLVRSAALLPQPVDVAYADPPYAPHQYGSNYHLLTTIARWDRPAAPLDLDERGVLRSKAGIRPDWVATRSAYCSRDAAESALADLVGAVRARIIIVSYSSEGIVPLRRLLEICEARGSVSVRTNEYTTYPGGKQSSTRMHRNLEVVVTVDTSRAATLIGRHSAQLTLERRRVCLLFTRRFVRRRLEGRFSALPGSAELGGVLPGRAFHLRTREDGTLELPDWLGAVTLQELAELHCKLEECACRDVEEELTELLRLARDSGGAIPGRTLLRLLRRLGHRKYRERFDHWLGELRSLATDRPGRYAALGPNLDGLEVAVMRRLRG
jgi:adenine-specific DNA-methyltransferase